MINPQVIDIPMVMYLPERVSGAGGARDDGSTTNTVLVLGVKDWKSGRSGHICGVECVQRGKGLCCSGPSWV